MYIGHARLISRLSQLPAPHSFLRLASSKMGTTRRILKKLETKHPEGLTRTELFLASEDLLPVTEEKKTWDYWNFVGGSRSDSD